MARAREYEVIMANMDQNASTDTEPVAVANVQSATPEPKPAQAVNIALETGTEQAQEIVALREELVAQEALRKKERE